MKIRINEHFGEIKESYLFSDIAKRVKAYTAEHPEQKIIRLGIGDVTLPLTKSVIEAMHNAVDEMAKQESFRGYAPEYGYDFLRQAIADYYARLGVTLDAEEIFVSDGAKSDIGNLVDIFADNDILIPDPVYPVYVDSNLMSGRRATLLEANAENGFLPMPNGVEEKPYLIYLCSPNNPTGAVYSREQLTEWVSFARRTGSLILLDSAYESYISGDYPHSGYEIEGARSCVIEICSLSKTAGFTGTRCGWTVLPAELEVNGVKLSKLWARRQATKFNGVPYVVQRAAEAAVSEKGHAEAMESVAYYMENARILAEFLKEKEIWFTGGENSPYIWLRCPNGMGSWEFFDYLLQNAQVVGTPGEGFGKCGEGYFRLTSFGSRESTVEAVERLRKLL